MVRIYEVGGEQWQRFDVPPDSEQEFLVIQGDPPIRVEVSPFSDEGYYYAVYVVTDTEILYASMTVGEPVAEGIADSKEDARQIGLLYARKSQRAARRPTHRRDLSVRVSGYRRRA